MFVTRMMMIKKAFSATNKELKSRYKSHVICKMKRNKALQRGCFCHFNWKDCMLKQLYEYI